MRNRPPTRPALHRPGGPVLFAPPQTRRRTDDHGSTYTPGMRYTEARQIMYHNITPEDLRVLTKHLAEQGTPYTSRASRRKVAKLKRAQTGPTPGNFPNRLDKSYTRV